MKLKINSRHKKILDVVNEQGRISNEELCEMFDVSPVTIRRDLIDMEAKKLITRYHGGAKRMNTPVTSFGDSFQSKIAQQADEKMRIGLKATEYVNNRDIVFMNSGTTVLKFLTALSGKKLTVITNNAAAAQCDLDEGISLMMLGGDFHRQLCSFSGEMTIRNIDDIYSSVTFLGANAIDFDRGIMSNCYQECGVNNAMINHSRGKVIILADHTKIGKLSHFVSSPLSKIDIIITDSSCPASYVSELEARGVKVEIV